MITGIFVIVETTLISMRIMRIRIKKDKHIFSLKKEAVLLFNSKIEYKKIEEKYYQTLEDRLYLHISEEIKKKKRRTQIIEDFKKKNFIIYKNFWIDKKHLSEFKSLLKKYLDNNYFFKLYVKYTNNDDLKRFTNDDKQSLIINSSLTILTLSLNVSTALKNGDYPLSKIPLLISIPIASFFFIFFTLFKCTKKHKLKSIRKDLAFISAALLK